MYLSKQTFLVLGLSRSGISVARFLLSKGAGVYLYDDTMNERVEVVVAELSALGAKKVAKEDLGEMLTCCTALVLSPGVPIDHSIALAFRRAKKAVLGETEIAARYMRCPVIAVSGTNGKTTTVSMLEKVCNQGGVKAFACGNIGSPMVDFCEGDGIAIAEISSFQLETLNSLRPHIAILLNITEDHLDRHYTMQNYVFLKAKLMKNLTETEYAILNYDDEYIRGFAEKTKGQIVWFSIKEKVNGAYYHDGDLYFGEEKIVSASDLNNGGIHTIQNALAVVAAAKLIGVSNDSICTALTSFKGIRHRIEFVDKVDGVTYVDDSKGTNIDATLKAVSMMKEETILLLGGKNKGYDYLNLFAALKSSSVVSAVLYGENRYALLKCAIESAFDKVTLCERFDLAVRIASLQAKSGQTVLLSPASASFDEFSSYEERGDRFVEMVRYIASERGVESICSKEEEG